jgi:hypothetical protein
VAWLLSGWQASMYFVKVHESAGSLAAMEPAAVGTRQSQTWTAISAMTAAVWHTFGLEGCIAGNMIHRLSTREL